MNIQRLRAEISGRVQGVGFRPTVCRHARELALSGFVKNTPDGVLLEIQGPPAAVGEFVTRLHAAPPRQSRIDSIRTAIIPAASKTGQFEILTSSRSGNLRAGMPPDLATCEECRTELFNPTDRRHLYPFINCVNCGPRFTIISELPYDRERTSMASFTLCPQCRQEYLDSLDRRFDAQPNACPICGPQLRLIDTQGTAMPAEVLKNGQDGGKAGAHSRPTIPDEAAIREAVRVLKDGGILALKGLGGYHLACNANSDAAVARLRARKLRPHKSLAVMFATLDQIHRHAEVSRAEANWLSDCTAPIVILHRKNTSSLSYLISPDTEDIGAFLPYSPLHHLLLAGISPLVMTSGNLAEEPIAMDEAQLKRILGTIADATLTHNRPILRRCDDSVLKIVRAPDELVERPRSGGCRMALPDQSEPEMEGRAPSRPDDVSVSRRLLFRRSRGFVPDSIRLPLAGPPVLACGADLKNTIGLTRGAEAFLSQHIGDLEDFASFQFYRETIADLAGLLKIQPALIAHDLHPDYHSTRFALSPEAGSGKRVAVQHHHAHIAACLAEHGLAEPMIGVALDGTGYGPDGTIWGGEFLIADLRAYRRVGHFKQYRMPGGTEAIRHPERMAFSMLLDENLAEAFDLLTDLDANQINMLTAMLGQALNSPLTSSAGRLFDAVAALLGVGESISYEARAAIRLQTLTDRNASDHYPFEIVEDRTSADCRAGTPKGLPAFALCPGAELRGTSPADLEKGSGGQSGARTCPPYNHSPKEMDGGQSTGADMPALQRIPDILNCRAGMALGLPADSGIGTCPPCNGLILSFGPMFRALAADLRGGGNRSAMAGKFYNTVTESLVEMCRRIREKESLEQVVLSGGVFQNDLLLDRVTKGLQRERFKVYSHQTVPPNDSGIALGQAAVALNNC